MASGWLSDLLSRVADEHEPRLPKSSETPPGPVSEAAAAAVMTELESLILEEKSNTQPLAPAPFTAKGNRSSEPTFTSRVVHESKPVSRLDELNRALRKLQNDSPGIEASALISEDGLMIASALPEGVEETRVAGMTATLLNLGSRGAVELNRGGVQEIIVRGERGYAVLIGAGRGVLLLALTDESSKLGLVFFDMRETVRALQRVL